MLKITNMIVIIVLFITYIINSLYVIKYVQNDNYHLRSIKSILINDIKKRPYIFILLMFIFVKRNILINTTIILLSVIIILENIRKNTLKLKITKRLIRLLGIDLLINSLVFIFQPFLVGLLLINTFYLLTTFSAIFISNLIEKLLLKKYIKQATQKLIKYDPNVIAITGSCGKTSVKNYIYECLNDELILYKSPKSYNTLVGLLITINNNLHTYDNIFVLEMGLSYKNDIKKITKVIKPNISIITEILPSHLETMKTIDNIIDEKMQIIKNTKPNGLIIINNDNEYIKNSINKYNINNNKIIKIGFNKENDYYCKDYIIKKDGLIFDLIDNTNKKQYKIESKLIGKHNIYNILITYALLKYYKIDEKLIISKLSNLENYENRLEIKKINKLTILNDSYNSNINGFINALEVLSLYETNKYIITPGIVESGKENKNQIKILAKKISQICDFCYLIDNKNVKEFVKQFKEINYNKYIIKKSFFEAFEEVKNKEITLLIENDLTDFYLSKK